MPYLPDGFVCQVGEAWLAYHGNRRSYADTVVYCPLVHGSHVAKTPFSGPFFGCVVHGSAPMLAMSAECVGNISLSPADAWRAFGEMLGAPDLSSWLAQVAQARGEAWEQVLSFAILDRVKYFGSPIPLGTGPFTITPQDLLTGRLLDEDEVMHLGDVVFPLASSPLVSAPHPPKREDGFNGWSVVGYWTLAAASMAAVSQFVPRSTLGIVVSVALTVAGCAALAVGEIRRRR